MAKVFHTCTGCIPIDASIIDVYTQMIRASALAEAAAKKAEEASVGKAPYVGENGDWWEWDEEQKTFVDTGIQAETGMTVDDEMSETSTYPVQNKVITSALNGKQATLVGSGDGQNIKTINNQNILGSGNIDAGSLVTIDSALSTTSTNPVQNKVINTALGGKQDTISDLATIRSGAAAGATAVQPSALSAKQDVLVAGTNIMTINNQSILGSGNMDIEGGGVGFDSITTPSTPDGTMIITLTNGDTITMDLNHNHPQYPKYVYCATQAAYDAIVTKENDTLYLILETN